MEVVIMRTAAELAALAADSIENIVRTHDAPVLGLATGSSPLPIYAELIKRHQAGLSFAHVRTFSLDEYVGLPDGHPESYREVIRRELTSQLDILDENVKGPDGTSDDVAHAGPRYDAEIQAAGGVDLQILGIGSDGHLAFNEPGSSLASRTRVKTLTQQTREDNARFFASADEVPHHVLTQGLGTVLEARHLVLIATGEGKAEAVTAMIEGPLSAFCPASVVQLHPHVTVLLDEDAAAGLSFADYYRYSFENKPAWQGL